ncbi:MAG: serine/threonine protein kinase [Alphaproteobacteria bacterium]|nr:serine/threonine protein kinase [Alphaproteobacteria bacterium]
MPRSFRFLDKLGRGAFGEVHLAELRTDEDFVQTVAVKWLHSEYSDDVELAGRLRDEARLLGLLQHPNVVRVSGLTRIDGRLAVLMEPVAGRDLTGAHVPPRATAEIVAAVADALDAAWETVPPGRSEPLRVVHRDIKPSNIMVTRRGQVKVMDFGVARATFESREAQTRSQQYGTARYMAPERWIEGIAEAPSDVFSLGITLVELASGEAVGRPRLSREGFDADLAEPIARLDAWPELRDLAREMVAFSPADRPSAAAVSERLGGMGLPGPGLRQWAGEIEVAAGTPDAMTGTVVVEDTNAATFALDGSAGTVDATTAAYTADVALAPPELVATAAPAPATLPRVAAGIGALAIALLVLLFGVPALLDGPADVPGPGPASAPENTAPVPEPAAAVPEPAAPVPEPAAPAPVPEPTAPAPAPEPAPVEAPVPLRRRRDLHPSPRQSPLPRRSPRPWRPSRSSSSSTPGSPRASRAATSVRAAPPCRCRPERSCPSRSARGRAASAARSWWATFPRCGTSALTGGAPRPADGRMAPCGSTSPSRSPSRTPRPARPGCAQRRPPAPRSRSV